VVSFRVKAAKAVLASPMRMLLLTGLWSLAATLQAGLTFDQNPLQINPKPEDEEIESTFTFTNTGSKPIQVTGLESSCSCLEASLDKAVYQPGEKGKGKAKFKVSSFTGKNEKFLHIYTDDPDAKDIVMTAVIDVPVVVQVEPKLVEWITGDKPEPKQYTVKMLGPDEIHIKQVSSTREVVKADFAEIKPGREYQITVTPSSTTDIIVGAVRIETDSKIPKYQRQLGFFNILRPDQVERRKKLEQEEEKKP
jgi:Protein of unknown function (DUF1573)